MEKDVELKDGMLQSHLSLDKYHLDEEWENQPLRYMYYAEQYVAKARELLDKKNLLNARTAEVELEIRGGDRDIGVKVTEGAVKAAVEIDDELRQIKLDMAELKGESDMLASIVSAFEHRKKALEHEGTLLINGFYAVPDTGRVADVGQREMAARSRNKKNEEIS